jgi:hypothetical protein
MKLFSSIGIYIMTLSVAHSKQRRINKRISRKERIGKELNFEFRLSFGRTEKKLRHIDTKIRTLGL